MRRERRAYTALLYTVDYKAADPAVVSEDYGFTHDHDLIYGS